MSRFIHDMQGEVQRGDSMRNPKYRDGNALKRFDLVIANPMWNQSFDPKIFENDAFNRFEEAGGITPGKADWARPQTTVASPTDHARPPEVPDTGAGTAGSASHNGAKSHHTRT